MQELLTDHRAVRQENGTIPVQVRGNIQNTVSEIRRVNPLSCSDLLLKDKHTGSEGCLK